MKKFQIWNLSLAPLAALVQTRPNCPRNVRELMRVPWDHGVGLQGPRRSRVGLQGHWGSRSRPSEKFSHLNINKLF